MPTPTPTLLSERSKSLALAGICEYAIEAADDNISFAKECLKELDPESYAAWKLSHLITRLEITKRIFAEGYKENEPILGVVE